MKRPKTLLFSLDEYQESIHAFRREDGALTVEVSSPVLVFEGNSEERLIKKLVPQWISVDDDLPPLDEHKGNRAHKFSINVLACDESKTIYCAYTWERKGNLYWYSVGGGDVGGVTHWMYLPEVPNE